MNYRNGGNKLSTWSMGLLVLAAVICASVQPAAAQNLSGAIFTSKTDGTLVNGNNYDSKCDVALNGGPPPNAPCTSAGLPDGCYVFQVTAPPGGGATETLLSQDSITKRFLKVSGGKFVHDNGTCAAAAAGLTDCGPAGGDIDSCPALSTVVNLGAGDPGHQAGPGKCSGALAAQLEPYFNTPNHGGVYKAYITKISDYDNSGACGGVFGFIHDRSKTDNFRVKSSEPPPPPQKGFLTACKYYDANADAAFDNNESLVDWAFQVDPLDNADPNTAVQTGACVTWEIDPDNYTVQEGVPVETNWFNTDPGPNPTHLVAGTVVSKPATVVAGETTEVDFGNYCVGAGGGLTLGFWSNKNGQALTTASDLCFLNSLCLRKANGTDFDPVAGCPSSNSTQISAGKSALRSWLLNATAVNMSYMLSAQLTAMEMNVRHNFVSGGALVQTGPDPDNCNLPGWSNQLISISNLMADANTELCANGNTVAAGHDRTCQEFKKNALDNANNNRNFVQAQACSATFDANSFPAPQ